MEFITTTVGIHQTRSPSAGVTAALSCTVSIVQCIYIGIHQWYQVNTASKVLASPVTTIVVIYTNTCPLVRSIPVVRMRYVCMYIG
jgi:hypothetical protein